MVVHRRVHQGAGYHQPLGRGDPAAFQDYPVVDHGHRLDEPVAVYPPVADPRVQGIPHQVVHLIGIDRAVDDLMGVVLRWEVAVPVPIAVHHLGTGRFGICYEIADVLRRDAFGRDDLGHRVHASEQIGILFAEIRDLSEHQGARHIHMAHPRGVLHGSFQCMGVGRMAYIVQQSRHADRTGILVVKAYGLRHAARQAVRS